MFFSAFAGLFGLIGSIPYFGELFFAIPYLFYFLGSVFSLYTLFVLMTSLLYTPAIVGAYEEDTMGTVFQSYSITWSQPWRVLLYNLLLLPLIFISLEIFSWFWLNAYGFINYVFGCDWFMGEKLLKITTYAASLVCPAWMSEMVLYLSLIHI